MHVVQTALDVCSGDRLRPRLQWRKEDIFEGLAADLPLEGMALEPYPDSQEHAPSTAPEVRAKVPTSL